MTYLRFLILLLTLAILSGCQSDPKSSQLDSPGKEPAVAPIPTPSQAQQWANGDQAAESVDTAEEEDLINRPIRGKIIMVEPRLKYVVVDFGITRLPRPGQSLPVYEDSKKTGTIRITTQPNQFQGNKVVADITNGGVLLNQLVYSAE